MDFSISLNILGVGDGYCYDETNNVECNYDGGDCCLSSPNTDNCSDCSCHFLGPCLNGTHSLIGNGVCNDVTNIALCMFDGLDCCGFDFNNNDGVYFYDFEFEVDDSTCTECSCHSMYLSISVRSWNFKDGGS